MKRLIALLLVAGLAAGAAGCMREHRTHCVFPDGPATVSGAAAGTFPTGGKSAKNDEETALVEQKRSTNGNEKTEKKENENGNEKTEKKEDKSCAPEKPPKALLQWAIGKEPKKDNGKTNGNSNGDQEEGEDRIVTDRPDFTEASTTVGRGRLQLEAGYTFTRFREAGALANQHAYPEMLWRIGLFSDWFELRIGQNFFSEAGLLGEVDPSPTGADDLYLGVKIALTEQKKFLPETAVILQMTVPTGAGAFTTGEVMPGFNYSFGWDIIKDCLNCGGSFLINRAQDDTGHFYAEVAQSFTIGYFLTRKVGAFTEWFAFFPSGAIDPNTGPEHYFDGGFTYLINNNFQLDIRGGVGLNRHADNFFVGSGFAVRY